jgi:hypothetical protein
MTFEVLPALLLKIQVAPCVVEARISDVSKDRSASIFRVKDSTL